MNLNAFFRSAKFRVLLCVLALLTGVMLYSIRSGAQTDRLTRLLHAVTAPFRHAASAIQGEVDERLDTYYEAKAYREEMPDCASRMQSSISSSSAMRRQSVSAMPCAISSQSKRNMRILSPANPARC